ncbi:class I SAM-dependent methyltransferase [Bacteroidia bacterium]|nr:class I SAM-dependent methyltransferase [Bacteroidia bacterium]MDB9881895.1 class I SAM-dependent methyltransferase [Bacteroidia bacterium]MDC1394914.1 class I SAM-dependent methyltransferase [Bacteroidia bacterium]
MIEAIFPLHWNEYELIDSGDGMKLEKYGHHVLARPEPQAIWSPRLSRQEWDGMATGSFAQQGSHKGEWRLKGNGKSWFIKYGLFEKTIKMKLNFTQFKHIGIFPEQAANWDYIYKRSKSFGSSGSVLNLFAYTGGASLAAKAAGVDVVHVDSIKQVVKWASENQEQSKLKDIRWVVEDALKFVGREVKRGRKYQGIILDPPAYGIGTKGERWKLEEKLGMLLQQVSQLLDEKGFLVLNVYSLGLSPYIIQNLMTDYFPNREVHISELCLKSRTEQILPLGIVARI